MNLVDLTAERAFYEQLRGSQLVARLATARGIGIRTARKAVLNGEALEEWTESERVAVRRAAERWARR